MRQDKLVRMGVPVYTSHTILTKRIGFRRSVTIAKVDDHSARSGTERTRGDSVLIAVGLDPVDEFYHSGRLGMTAFVAGDAEDIASFCGHLLRQDNGSKSPRR